MTSRLRKKRQTTAPIRTARIRIDRALAVAAFSIAVASWTQSTSAQSSWETSGSASQRTQQQRNGSLQFRTSPRFDATVQGSHQQQATNPHASVTEAPSRSLRWRSSARVQSQAARASASQSFQTSNGPVMRVVYQEAGAAGNAFQDPFGELFGGQEALPKTKSPAAPVAPNDLFGNPLGNDPVAPPKTNSPEPMQLEMPVRPAPLEAVPNDNTTPAPVEDPEFNIPEAPAGSEAPSIPEMPAPPEGSSLMPPSTEERSDPSNSQLDLFNNPFRRDAKDSPSDREPSNREAASPKEDMPTVPDSDFENDPPQQRGKWSCDKHRAEVASMTIDKISLDISPAFRPDVIDEEKFQEAREAFDRRQEARDWRNRDGSLVVNGRLVDMSYQAAVIESGSGTQQKIRVSELSESDLTFLSEEWGLPQECRIAQANYVPRNWHPTKMTWKASGLCHNPLYFEEVQLERYGHSAGPIKQPIISTAHFFANIAVLPYKMGIHPPSECQYALGYYRPGNCAPYLLPPIPISLRGAVSQAAVIAGGFAIIP